MHLTSISVQASSDIHRLYVIGFGLRVNHHIHQVAKAAGISDLSAKVYGSLNGTRVVKLAVQMLHGSSLPLGEFAAAASRSFVEFFNSERHSIYDQIWVTRSEARDSAETKRS